MRSLKAQIVVQLTLWYASFALFHGLRRIFAYHYHRALTQMGSALPVPTESLGIPVLGGGFYCPQPHTLFFWLFWGALAATPLGVAFFALRGRGEEEVRFRLWHGWMTVYYLTVVVLLLTVAACLALPFVPIGAVVR
jgi:hypothetical protein